MHRKYFFASIFFFWLSKWRSHWLKGIVHPKMKILSLITHPHVVPNPQDLHECKWMAVDGDAEELLNKVIIFVFFAHKNSHSFIKLQLNHWCHMDHFNYVLTTFFWALIVVVHLLSMQGQKALGFHQKYLNLCSLCLMGLEQHEGE